MYPSISEQKQQFRRQSKAVRKDLGDEVRWQASQAICARLAKWDVFQTSAVILTYMPMRTEVDLRPLLVGFPEKRWLLPRIIPGECGRMVFHAYDPYNLVIHPFGMAEPAPYLPEVSPADIELVLVPGLAFDRSGWRLGYGGGYFDRFLQGFAGVSVGVVFQTLLLDYLPHDVYDISMHWLATEAELTRLTPATELF